MSEVFDVIGSGMAKAELAVAKATGTTIGFQHRDELPVPLRVSLLDYNIGSQDSPSGRKLETADITFIVASQSPLFSGVSGFSGTSTIYAMTGQAKPVTVGDRIEWPLASQRYFYVIDEPKPCIHNGHAYVIHASSHRTLTAGQYA